MTNNQRLAKQNRILEIVEKLNNRKNNVVKSYGLQYSIMNISNKELAIWEEQINNISNWLTKLDVLGVGNAISFRLHTYKDKLVLTVEEIHDNIKIPASIKNIKFKESHGSFYGKGTITIVDSDSIYNSTENLADALVFIERNSLVVPHDKLIKLAGLTFNPLLRDLKNLDIGESRYINNKSIRQSFVNRLCTLFKKEMILTFIDNEQLSNNFELLNQHNNFTEDVYDPTKTSGREFIKLCYNYVKKYDKIYESLLNGDKT